VNKAGQQSELGRQRRKKGVELRKDVEIILLSNQASLAGNSTTPPLLGGLPSWIVTNDNRGTGGADGGFNQGTGLTVAATNGTQRAFTKAIMDDIFQKQFANGGKGNVLMVAPYVKTVFSSFMSDPSVAPQRMATSERKQATIVGAADTYVGDFGVYDIVPNRVMATSTAVARNAYVLDPDVLHFGVFDDVKEVTPAVTGDATKKVLIMEYTLIVDNEAGVGIASDLFGTSSTT
jgi:hypothetical protein